MNKEFLKKCWKNPRWHSLMVLMIWIVSLTILMGIVSILNQFGSYKEPIKKAQIQENENRISYEEMWKFFETKDYAFTYTISKYDEIVKYEGNVKEDTTTGYRERQDGIIRYSIEDGIVYENLVNDKKEIQTLYENVDESLLNTTYLYDFIKEIPASDTNIIEENEKTTYEYSTKMEEEAVKIMVITSDAQIQTITIEKDRETYTLAFDFAS